MTTTPETAPTIIQRVPQAVLPDLRIPVRMPQLTYEARAAILNERPWTKLSNATQAFKIRQAFEASLLPLQGPDDTERFEVDEFREGYTEFLGSLGLSAANLGELYALQEAARRSNIIGLEQNEDGGAGQHGEPEPLLVAYPAQHTLYSQLRGVFYDVDGRQPVTFVNSESQRVKNEVGRFQAAQDVAIASLRDLELAAEDPTRTYRDFENAHFAVWNATYNPAFINPQPAEQHLARFQAIF